MINTRRTSRRPRQWNAGAGLAGGAVVAAMLGALGVPAARADDLASDIGLASASGNQFDPAVIPYSPDPSNLFAPVYTIAPVGPEEAISTVTDPNNVDTTDTFGTQDFSLSTLGFPVDSFTGNVEYSPTPFDDASGLSGIVSQLGQEFGLPGGYSEEITTLGGTGTVLPDEPTSFLISEFGLGYGNVFEESMNSAGTSATVGDFILTPFGNENITPIVDLFLPQGVGVNDLASGAAAEPVAAASGAGSTPDDVIGQAITDLNQGPLVLATAPTADLSTRSADLLSVQEGLPAQIDPILTQTASLQDQLSPGDQSLLALLDEQLVSAAQNVTSADQAFVAADQAGELSGSGLNLTDLTALGADLNLAGAGVDVSIASVLAGLTGGLDPSSAADLTSGIDPVTAVDPSVFADLLSSIGL